MGFIPYLFFDARLATRIFGVVVHFVPPMI
jgi:hypothetical protein